MNFTKNVVILIFIVITFSQCVQALDIVEPGVYNLTENIQVLNINGGSGEYIINGNGYRVIESSNIISTENTILNVSLNNITFNETLTVTGERGANGVDGKNGVNGNWNGKPGTAGKNAGCVNFISNNSNYEKQIIFIQNDGGNGGRGGRGLAGNKVEYHRRVGGNGGDGGNGGSFIIYLNTCNIYGFSISNLGSGGTGGNGNQGGEGSYSDGILYQRGADGGRGGNSGNSGSLKLNCVNCNFFNVISIGQNSISRNAGAGGNGGYGLSGFNGGNGGYGGNAGKYGDFDVVFTTCKFFNVIQSQSNIIEGVSNGGSGGNGGNPNGQAGGTGSTSLKNIKIFQQYNNIMDNYQIITDTVPQYYISPIFAENIMGGDYIAGNYWTSFDKNGFSDQIINQSGTMNLVKYKQYVDLNSISASLQNAMYTQYSITTEYRGDKYPLVDPEKVQVVSYILHSPKECEKSIKR